MPERRVGEVEFVLTPEEASAVMGYDMGAEITPHMEKILESISARSEKAKIGYNKIVALAVSTEGVVIGMSFDENFFKNLSEIKQNFEVEASVKVAA